MGLDNNFEQVDSINPTAGPNKEPQIKDKRDDLAFLKSQVDSLGIVQKDIQEKAKEQESLLRFGFIALVVVVVGMVLDVLFARVWDKPNSSTTLVERVYVRQTTP